MKKIFLVMALLFMALSVKNSYAAMNGNIGASMMGGSPVMTNSGSLGMMNGMTGAPVVGSDGTAYIVSYNTTYNAGNAPDVDSFTSTIYAVKTTGEITSLTLKGIASRPVLMGSALVATTSLPDFSNYMMAANYGSGSSNGQSALYVIALPVSSSTKPTAISMDGSFASVPVVENNKAYVVTTDYGNAMMSGSYNYTYMYGNYNYNYTGSAKTYLYIFNIDGSLYKKVVIE